MSSICSISDISNGNATQSGSEKYAETSFIISDKSKLIVNEYFSHENNDYKKLYLKFKKLKN
jgi:hypothetical protein